MVPNFKTNQSLLLGLSFFIFLVFLSSMIFLSNQLIAKLTQNIELPIDTIFFKESSPPGGSPSSIFAQKLSADELNAQTQNMLCQTHVIRGTDVTENVFYKEGIMIARQLVSSFGEILEQTGTIPEGVVQLEDDYNQFKGEMRFVNGLKEGETKVFYSDGVLQSQTLYQQGQIKTRREFYHSGQVRFELDYTDALGQPQKDKEVGVGKLYFPDGTLKYEWDITRNGVNRYKKSYNKDGSLRFEVILDGFGQILTQKTFDQEKSLANENNNL